MPTATSLALCFTMLDLGYALPFAALPTSNALHTFRAQEVLNLYALVAWMGLSHFYFAFKGQGISFIRNDLTKRGLIFVAVAVIALIILAVTRSLIGFAIFNVLTWIYFIPHFIKAELFFNQKTRGTSTKIHYLFPTIAFIYFSLALFARAWFLDRQWLLFVLALAVIAICLPFGLVQSLREKSTSSLTLLGFFILAEGLVWGTYGKYMVASFADGVYTFHVAAASFYHYFRAYHFAALDMKPNQRIKYWLEVFVVNLTMLALGYVILNFSNISFLGYLFDPYWFTVWVAWHLVCSDVFPLLRHNFSRG